MSTLPTPLRRQLATAVNDARTIAARGALKALEALAVHEADPYAHMDEAHRGLRRRLRAQARQLGDSESPAKRGQYKIAHLVEKLAYDQWHRLLFARFLLDNNLLISPEHGVSVSLEDCEELAPSLGLRDAWAVAARFAAQELPDIFRTDDPAGEVDLPVEDRNPLVQIVLDLPTQVFTASDSLGWCYQFWQAEKKDAVNAVGNKIGADELPAVTQLFTEDYMVDFLLDNTLGAWHAGKVLAANPVLAESAESEVQLRDAVSLPGCPWNYLRFIRPETGAWTPAAGTFDGWPRTAAELKCLDPCMGSGHFVVAMFERLVALRLADEELDEAAAVAAVIRDNLFGLEIDPRCTQIGAFNLALAAWRRVGHCRLPAMNLACSGLAPNTREADWLAVAGEDDRLTNGMERLYRLFKDAPILGSLINPRAGGDDLLMAAFHELQPLLDKALAQETQDVTMHEMVVTARGLAKATRILAGQFTLVATNVPYLGRGKQDRVLQDYCERLHTDAKYDLAACFLERGLEFCASGGSTALVTPQSWLFQTTYTRLRRDILQKAVLNVVAKLGARAFETIGGEVVSVVLVAITRTEPRAGHTFAGADFSDACTPGEKAAAIATSSLSIVSQSGQSANPDSRIGLSSLGSADLLAKYGAAYQGIATADYARFGRVFWEFSSIDDDWEFQISTVERTASFSGREHVLWWQNGRGSLASSAQARVQGLEARGKWGVAVSQMQNLPVSIYCGELFDNNCSALVVADRQMLPAAWAFCSSSDFGVEIRKFDQALKVTNASLVKVPFDVVHWQKVAAEKYPHGLPKPFSSDPTQWLFNGHPAGADQPLHVAVARLLGYEWPRQTGSSFPDCPALGPDGLETLADDDGIVPISPAKGEGPAAERLRALLARAYGTEWNATRLEELLAQVGNAGGSLEDWLRNSFFEQHCALFHHRPFIWHVWDGRKDGFGALVNYHRLTHAGFGNLTFAYLGDWIRRQQAAVEAGEAGSDARLEAAQNLQARLKLILEGEPPYDIFVRWKPLASQAIGWQPDINDGVRMNIRPFLAMDIPGGKKGAGVLRAKPNIKWEKDRGKEPVRDKAAFPWFWGWDEKTTDFAGGREFDGNRWNACHYTNAVKQRARDARSAR